MAKQTGRWIGRNWKWLCLAVPLTVFLGGISLSNYPTTVTPLPTGKRRSYHEILDWALKNGMPGGILLVSTPNERFLESAGYADLRRRRPMRTDHAFQIGSITKSFLGTVAAQLHAEGRLDLDGAITNWLPPELSARFPNADRVTLRHLLEHRSGFRDFGVHWRRTLDRAFLDRYGDWGPGRELQYCFDEKGAFMPGEKCAYSNTGYALAGLIIDRVAGRHHSAEIRDRILEPLGLGDTWYLSMEPPRAEIARGYENWSYWWRTETTNWPPATGGHAGLASTVTDLARFMRSVARHDEKFLEPRVRSELLSGWGDKEKWYFLGVHRTRCGDGAPWFLGHSGATPGYHCFAFCQPERDITVVFFGSSALLTARGGKRLDNFYDELRDALFEKAVSHASP